MIIKIYILATWFHGNHEMLTCSIGMADAAAASLLYTIKSAIFPDFTIVETKFKRLVPEENKKYVFL